jgi:hypothetical protein
MANRKIHDVKTDWLRIPLSQPIAGSSHVLSFVDLLVVGVRAGDQVGESYMLSFDYAPALLKGVVDQELRRYTVGQNFYREHDLYLAAACANILAIESFDWLDPLLEHPLEIGDGHAHVPDRWNKKASRAKKQPVKTSGSMNCRVRSFQIS